MPGADDKELLSLTEAAAAVKMPRPTLYLWVVRNEVPAQRVAGRFVIRRSDLEVIRARLARTTKPAA